jgi:hypothetical protein
MSTKPTLAIVRDAEREHPLQAALAALDRSIAEEQEFDAARAGYLAPRPRAINTTERGA